jgi:hypothetical protein
MLIVIPVSYSDSNLIDSFSKVLKVFGPYPNHEILIVSRPYDLKHSLKLLSNIKGLFKKESLHIFNREGIKNWPDGPNFYWSETIRYLYKQEYEIPWFWMELDTTPIKHNWINDLEFEYNTSNSLYTGCIEDTPYMERKGVALPPSKHVVGVAVYPPAYIMGLTIPNLLFVEESGIAFDVFCQDYTTPKAKQSTILQHCFRTQKYRRGEDGMLIGEESVLQRGKEINTTKVFAVPLKHSTSIVHGCDDGSLASLIFKENQ